jgi:site-specific DNA-methyltransferase (adenine-specific)
LSSRRDSTTHDVFFGDARSMSGIDDQAVRLIVTSPPYWQLKDYGDPGQIGFDDTYEQYVNNLNLVWMECHRVLHDGCRMCINIGDQFARAAYYGRYKVIPIRTEIIRFCETVGFDFMGAIVWQKVTTCHTTGGAIIMGSYPFPRNGIVKLDYEHILLFKKHGKAPKVPADIKEASRLTKDEWNTYFYGHWNFPGEKQKNHLAMFPEELPRRLIKMFSFVGERVCDPFLGSGTTGAVAAQLGRSSVGYEINRNFESLILDRMSDAKITMPAGPKTEPPYKTIDRNCLPYIFRDPLGLDKQTDPREKTFGSKISDPHRV